jgi:hypothetical protein
MHLAGRHKRPGIAVFSAKSRYLANLETVSAAVNSEIWRFSLLHKNDGSPTMQERGPETALVEKI